MLEAPRAELCRERLAGVLGTDLYGSLCLYLAYIKTCHIWVEMHPEMAYDADQRVRLNLGPLLAEEPALGDFFRNYQEKVGSQRLSRNERKAAGEVLRTAQASTTRILESITDGFHALDRDWRFTYLNAQAERLVFRKGQDLLGKILWDEFPETVGGTFYRVFRQAMDDRVFGSAEDYYPPLACWMDVRVYPSSSGLSVFFQNANARKEAEKERERLAERERNIASQLQEALLPGLPETVPGATSTMSSH